MKKIAFSSLFVVLSAGCVVGVEPERDGAGVADRCWGAWRDQNGLCRTPADGVYPDECCEPLTCDAAAQDPGCPAGQHCEPGVCLMYCAVDDPECCQPDTCQPDELCPEVMCALYCENGFVKDDNGCDTCQCAPDPVCPPVLCELYCENGFLKGDDGCAICACAPDPAQSCGGHLGLRCDEGEYCAYTPDEMCGAADQLGTCQPRPEACMELYQPVCGCDGHTYSNACFAASAGSSVASEGACEPVDCRVEGCGDGEYCTYCWGSWACIPDGAVC